MTSSFKKRYFESRINTLNDDRANLAQREIATMKILERITKTNFFKRSTTVVDLGCGDRFLEQSFINHGKKYHGLDIDSIDFDDKNMNFNLKGVDLFIAFSLFEHLNDPSIILNQIISSIKLGGYVYIETPNWRYSYKDFYNDHTHIRPYTPESLTNLMTSYGFNKIGVYPNLRCKNDFFYTNKYRFLVASKLPFLGSSSIPLPSAFKGRAKGMIGIFQFKES